MYVAFTPNSTGYVTDQITITDNAGGVRAPQQTITLTGTGVTAATAVTVQPTSLSFSSQLWGPSARPKASPLRIPARKLLNITDITTGTSGDFA